MFEIPPWLVQKLDETDKEIKKICHSEIPQMQQMLDYVFSVKGKQIRPMMTFLCSRLTGKKPNVVQLAAVVEICHVASLIHDDIIDDMSVTALGFQLFSQLTTVWEQQWVEGMDRVCANIRV